jgi:phage terminase large subunit
LPKEVTKEIESYQPTPENKINGTADERMWSIYGKGEVYKGKEIIFTEWKTYDKEPEGYDYVFFGLDWGHNHPLACTKVIINGKDIYVEEIMYKSNIDDLDEVVEVLKEQPEILDTYVVCDSSEPRSVNQLVRGGIPAMNVKKPPGSVLDGIRKMLSFNIHVHANSINIQNELNNYKWKVDTKTDSILDVPVKKHDDAMDSIRYPLYTFM